MNYTYKNNVIKCHVWNIFKNEKQKQHLNGSFKTITHMCIRQSF